MKKENGEISAFPKIWALGTKYAQGIFEHEVEITEKLDGSQFAFYWSEDGDLVVRSKGTIIDQNNIPDLFQPAVQHIQSIVNPITEVVYYAETLCRPKHNTLKYDRIPTNSICIFGAYDAKGFSWKSRHELEMDAKTLVIDVIPLLHFGKCTETFAKDLVGRESAYGGVTAEGIVIKAFKDVTVAGVTYPIHSAKIVTKEFKEKHQANPEFASSKSKADTLFEQYNSDARFKKAVQKLKESGEFTGDYKDIGKCMKILHQDLSEECAADVKDELFSIYQKDFIKVASKGFPEWFKSNLETML